MNETDNGGTDEGLGPLDALALEELSFADRLALCNAPHTDVTVLEYLARGDDHELLLAMATNEACPAYVLDILAHYSKPLSVRLGVAKHQAADLNTVSVLLGRKPVEPEIRLAIANNPSTPQVYLRALAHDPDPAIAAIASGEASE